MEKTLWWLAGNPAVAGGAPHHLYRTCDRRAAAWRGHSFLMAAAAGRQLFDYAVRVMNGKQASAELLGVEESAISRFGLSM